MSRKNAIKPLSKTMNDYQRGRRATRIMARRTIAEALAGYTIQATAPFRAGFWGRLRWVLFGMPTPQMPQTQSKAHHGGTV